MKQNLVDPQTQHELMRWHETITKQNYFAYNSKAMIQKEGLAMGAPSSSLIAEMFLQHTEHLHMARLSTKHRIINYFQYVNDILIIFDPSQSSIQAILADFNNLHSNLQCTAETEENNAINYLDITIHRTPSSWKTAIYIIPYTSNHPSQHKCAAVRFLYNRPHMCNLQPEEYWQEENTIHNILYNSFPTQLHKPHLPKPQKQQQTTLTQTQKWATFTYTVKETTYITNLFRYTNIKIAFHTNNTVYNRLTHKNHNTDKYTQSRVYKLTWPDCKKAYVGQTSRSLLVQYSEHKQAFRNNSHTSKFAQHLVEQAHTFSTIHNTMQVLHYQKKVHTSTR